MAIAGCPLLSSSIISVKKPLLKPEPTSLVAAAGDYLHHVDVELPCHVSVLDTALDAAESSSSMSHCRAAGS